MSAAKIILCTKEISLPTILNENDILYFWKIFFFKQLKFIDKKCSNYAKITWYPSFYVLKFFNIIMSFKLKITCMKELLLSLVFLEMKIRYGDGGNLSHKVLHLYV